MTRTTTIDAEAALKMLRAPFPEHQISLLPKETKKQIDDRKADRRLSIRCQTCGGWHHRDAIHLSYVGHAALTDRLLDADPNWNWEPLAFTPEGQPAFDRSGGMWIKMTVAGMTRIGYGSADGKTGGDGIKEVIGDALRNAAMRFGAALDLWHKGTLHLPESDGADNGNGDDADNGRSPVLEALLSNIPTTSRDHAVAWKEKQKEQIESLSEEEFLEFKNAWTNALMAFTKRDSAQPQAGADQAGETKKKTASAAEQKRGLAAIEKDLLDIHTEVALNLCADEWKATATEQGWSRDYHLEAKKRFDRRRQEIIDAAAADDQQEDDDYFPGDMPSNHDIRNHPLNAG